MRKMKQYCRRGFAMLLAFTLCMGLMQNAAFASTETDSSDVEVIEEVIEEQDIEEDSSEENEAAEDTQENRDAVSEAEDDLPDEIGTNVNFEVNVISVVAEDASPESTKDEVTPEETTEEATTEAVQEDDETEALEEDPTVEAPEADEAEEPVEVPTTEVTEEEDSEEEVNAIIFTDALGEVEVKILERTDTEETTETFPEADEKKEDNEWKDITDTKRPDASESVTADKGTDKDKVNTPEGEEKNWDIFYDDKRDVYKITFNIGSDAENTQVIDLTQALELLGQYAESGKEELQAAIDALDKPVKGDAGEAPVLNLPEEPKAPAGFNRTPPTEPDVPVEPGKPENLEENVGKAYENIIASVPRSDEGEPAESYDYASAIAEATGLSKDDPYVESMADYLYGQAMVDWCMSNWAQWEAEGHVYANYFGDPDTFLYYGCGITVKWPDGYNKGTPVLKQTAPEYEVDKNSEAYKDYENAKADYDDAKAKYDLELADYEAAREEYLAEHGPDSEEGKAFAAAQEAYNADWEKAMAEYEAAVAEYEANLAAIEAKYADDQAAYNAAVAQLKADFDRRTSANVLEPGDVKKFELFITSDSKHTYKYQSGSFTLATPGWTVNENGDVVGFDGQVLPDEYVDHNSYHVTVTAKPIQDLLKNLGVDDPENPMNNGNILGNGQVGNGHDGNGNITDYMGYWDNAIKAELAKYPGETLADQLNSYILAYYGGKYDSIDALIAGNPEAAVELTKTITSGNKWFELGGQTFEVQAHTATVKYDHFYKNLFSFAFGDNENGVAGVYVYDEDGNPVYNEDGNPKTVTMEEFLGNKKFNSGSNRMEYGNKSWTNNGYEMALYYYMDHKEIWQKTDAYFSALLDGGLTAEQATWTSLMMALNIDGELTGNDWQDTKWPWYNSIKLDRNDYEFHLTKTDENGNAITTSPAEFQLWYVNAKGDKVYLKQAFDADGEPVFTESSEPVFIRTEKGSLEGLYSMMKDKVYYLKETEAPEGYEIDPTIYVIGGEGNDKYLEDLKTEATEDIQGQIDKLMTEEYAANKAALEEIQAKVEELKAKDNMSAANLVAWVANIQTRLADLKSEGKTIEELQGMIADAADVFAKTENTLRGVEAAVNQRYEATVAEIARLNGELDSVKADFAALMAAYEASTDIAERNNLIDQMSALQAVAENLTEAMKGVKAAYEADEAHADYNAALMAANSALAEHNAYVDRLNGILSSNEYAGLQERIETLRGLKAAKDLLNGTANALQIQTLENKLKTEADRLFKDIAVLQADKDTDWVGMLNLTVYLENRKAIEEGTYEIPALPSAADGVSFETKTPDDVVVAEVEFNIPEPETPNNPPEEPERPTTPEEPTPNPRPNNPGGRVPNPPVPLTNIPNPEVPLANIPDEEVPLFSIPDEDVPLAGLPKTGDASTPWHSMMILSACCLLAMELLGKKKHEEENA